jgi:recombination protein RecT
MAEPRSSQQKPAEKQPQAPANSAPPARRSYQDKEAQKASNMKDLREMLAKMSKQLEHALPKFITPERMIRVATTTVQKVPKLLECHPVTVVGAVMQAAALGLEPDNVTGSAYLVPFWNGKKRRLECTLIPGYRGLMALARRSKEITAFDARVVKAGDLFDFEYGTRPFLKHRPSRDMENRNGLWVLKGTAEGDREPETIAAYTVAFYGAAPAPGAPSANHLSQFHVMFRPELERAKQFTASRDFNDKEKIVGPWIEHPDAMFTKTVIRRACKLLPFSIELMAAVGLEERAIAGRSQNLGAIAADDLGVQFDADDDSDDAPAEGEGGEAAIDPALVKSIDEAFAALQYSEARRTTKMQEFRGRLPELLLWLQAEALKNATPAGQGSTEAAAAERREEPAREEPKADDKPRRSRRFTI